MARSGDQVSRAPELVAAEARAQRKIDEVNKLIEARNALFRLVCELKREDAEYLTVVLGKLSHDDLRAVARYAAALADWPDFATESGNGTKITPG